MVLVWRWRHGAYFPITNRISSVSHHRKINRIFTRNFLSTSSNSSSGSGNGKGSRFLVPGATLATITMLGLLHARRLYDDKKRKEAKLQGMEPEFSPDFKASFLSFIPLRTLSRAWGAVTDVELPVWLRPIVYRSWARAFHTNLNEVAYPLEEYVSLRDFFAHTLKEGARTIDDDPKCLVSPVDGIVLRCGWLKEPGTMIEQVKGFSYPAISLLGSQSNISAASSQETVSKPHQQTNGDKITEHGSPSNIQRVNQESVGTPNKRLFYYVLYLGPGDYHRVHSPIDWQVQYRRHFTGHLLPVNERAARTIRNLHVLNERVVLEGKWSEGFMALVAVGATNVGSIKVPFDPDLVTNRPKKNPFSVKRSHEHRYQSNNGGLLLTKGEEVAIFNMGSTVVLVFQAPSANAYLSTMNSDSKSEINSSQGFQFLVQNGDKVQMGQAIGRW